MLLMFTHFFVGGNLRVFLVTATRRPFLAVTTQWNSSVGSVLGSRSCLMQRRGFFFFFRVRYDGCVD